MKHILEDLLSKEHYLESKELLYKIRTERGYETYDIFRRILYVAANFAGKWHYYSYNKVLQTVRYWLEKPRSYMDFSEFDYRLSTGGSYFMVKVDTILFKCWNQLAYETNEGLEKMNEKIKKRNI